MSTSLLHTHIQEEYQQTFLRSAQLTACALIFAVRCTIGRQRLRDRALRPTTQYASDQAWLRLELCLNVRHIL